MSDYQKWWEKRLRIAGLPSTTISLVLRDHSLNWGGMQPYVMKRSEMEREQVRSLIRAGVHYRTAYRKVTGR